MAPLLVVYILIAVVMYGFLTLARMEDVSFWVDLIKAAPFGFSALILGTFSVLFWSLNYLSRAHKSQLRVSEARDLFEVRRQAIADALGSVEELSAKEKAILSAHLLFSKEEVSAGPEHPSDGMSLNYSEVISQILKRS